MLKRIALLLFLAWQAVWTLAILPGHTRGVYSVDEPELAAELRQTRGIMPSCCQDTCPADEPTDKDGKPVDPAQHCYLCYLRGVLETPTTIDLGVPEREADLAFELPEYVERHFAIASPIAMRGRGPPSV